MAKSSARASVLWNEMKRFIGDDVRQFLSAPLDGIRARVQALSDRSDQIATAVQANTTTIAGKAPLQHTHARAEVTGLPTILSTLDARVTATEAAITQIKNRLGLP